MKLLVIPDVHLKPWMFDQAEHIVKAGRADRAICLMDIADDWNQQYNLDLYMTTYDRAIRFAQDFPDTLWCYGNHDLSYVWQMKETGYSPIAAYTVNEKLRILQQSLPDQEQIAIIHKIDDVLLMHGGLTDIFVREIVQADYEDTDAVIREINTYDYQELWNDASPLWFRPPYWQSPLYLPDTYLQVVGHTPMKEVTVMGSAILCDVFSTGADRQPIASQNFIVINTKTREFEEIYGGIS